MTTGGCGTRNQFVDPFGGHDTSHARRGEDVAFRMDESRMRRSVSGWSATNPRAMASRTVSVAPTSTIRAGRDVKMRQPLVLGWHAGTAA